MQRYEHYGSPDGGGPAEPVEEEDGGWVRYEDAVAAVAIERERGAQYLRDAAEMLAPEGRRTNQVDRHTARVLATNGDVLAAGFAVRPNAEFTGGPLAARPVE